MCKAMTMALCFTRVRKMLYHNNLPKIGSGITNISLKEIQSTTTMGKRAVTLWAKKDGLWSCNTQYHVWVSYRQKGKTLKLSFIWNCFPVFYNARQGHHGWSTTQGQRNDCNKCLEVDHFQVCSCIQQRWEWYTFNQVSTDLYPSFHEYL